MRPALKKTDNINERVDDLTFTVLKYGDKIFTPAINQEVIMYDGSEKVFGGFIVFVSEDEEDKGIVRYSVHASDYQTVFARRIVLERFRNRTATEIAAFLVEKYSIGFTVNNVDADVNIQSVTFDRIPLTEAFDKLARLIGYSWYIDYDKDVHLFAKNDEEAPFNITTNDGNYIPDSLEISHDLTQIRNRVTIRGGEVEGEERDQTFNGDGVKKSFVLAHKYARTPTVTVGDVAQTVGVAYLDDETLFDCVWSFSERSLRWQEAPTTGTNNIFVNGVPLFAIVVTRSDNTSINALKDLSRGVDGIFEYSIEDAKIRSREEAIQRGVAELEGYSAGIIEGSFETYTPGLRSGQTININIPHRGINEDFIIQRVQYTMLTREKGIYKVTIATARTVGIISLLQDLLRKRGAGETDQDLIVTQVEINDSLEVGETYSHSIQEPPYKIAPSDPDDDVPGESYLRINMSSIAASL
jgi:hypothetical protein